MVLPPKLLPVKIMFAKPFCRDQFTTAPRSAVWLLRVISVKLPSLSPQPAKSNNRVLKPVLANSSAISIARPPPSLEPVKPWQTMMISDLPFSRSRLESPRFSLLRIISLFHAGSVISITSLTYKLEISITK